MGKAAKQFISERNGVRYGGVICLPEVVQSIFRTYSTPADIREAVNEFHEKHQLIIELEQDLAYRLNGATYRCGNTQD